MASITLEDLTGQESGIVVYDAEVARVYNWSSMDGIPYDSTLGAINIPHEIPDVAGERCDDIQALLNGVELDRNALPDDEALPRTGTIYRISDSVLVIAPDDWC